MLTNPDWDAEAVGIIVLPAGPEGRGLLDVARRWTASWMLAPAFWVRAEDVPTSADGPPEIPALVLGRGPFGEEDEVEVELFWKLGEKYRPRVRLIAIRMLQSRDDEERTTQAIELIDSYLDRALPIRLPMDREQRPDDLLTEFLRLNLIVDAAEVKGLDAERVFMGSWQANIVASPEDRATPFSPDAPPIHPRRYTDSELVGVGVSRARAERYYGWALAHVASVAGIWAGLSQSIYDLMPPRPSVAHSMCLVQRVCVRGVVTDGLAISLAADAMKLAIDPSEEASRQVQMAIASHGVETISDADKRAKADAMVEFTLNGFRDHGFGYRSFEDPGPYTRPKVSLGRRLRLVATLGAKATVRSPILIAQLVMQRLSKRLTVENGDAIVQSVQTWNPGLPTVEDSVFTVPEVAIGSQQGVKSSPQVWRDLRDLLFGALDANPAHDIGQEILMGDVSHERMVFPSKTDVIPDPRASWSHEALQRVDAPPFPRIAWMNSSTAQETLRELNELYGSRTPLTHQMRKTVDELKGAEVLSKRQFERAERLAAGLEGDLDEAQDWLREMEADHPHYRRRLSDVSREEAQDE